MARIFITGSADGLGQLAAQELIKLGHQVILHARNDIRGKQSLDKVKGAADVLIADLSSMEETKALAATANTSGDFDVIIHNAGVHQVPRNSVGAEGFPVLFAVNSLAPYILTSLMKKPKRIIYLSSGMHLQGNANLDNLPVSIQHTGGLVNYSDTKLHNLILSMAVARKWPGAFVNAVDPGWVPTKMGGPGAPGDLEKGFQTQVWLAVSNEPQALVSGLYFHHKKPVNYLPAAGDVTLQEKFLALCEEMTGIRFGEDKGGE